MISLLAAVALAAIPPADVIYMDGPILTMVEGQPPAEALAVRNGRIAAVGKKADVLALRGPSTRVVALGKRALLPAFVDPHSHFLAAVAIQGWANVSLPPVGTVRSIPDIVAVLRKQAARQKAKPGDWIIAYGYDSNGLAEKRDVTRRDLDPAFPDNPVMLLHVSGHGAVLDTKAMEQVGLGPATVTPPGGIIVREPGSKQPAGLVMETAFLALEPKIPLADEKTLAASLAPAQELYFSYGYTVATEGATPPVAVAGLRAAARRGLLVIDVMALPLIESQADVVGKPGFEFGTTVDHVRVVGLRRWWTARRRGAPASTRSPTSSRGRRESPRGRASRRRRRSSWSRRPAPHGPAGGSSSPMRTGTRPSTSSWRRSRRPGSPPRTTSATWWSTASSCGRTSSTPT